MKIVIEIYKLIYFPIAKVACSSIKTTIAEILNLEIPSNEEYPIQVHNVEFPTAKCDQLSTIYKDYLKFAFVRNPWDRLVSCYINKMTKPINFENTYFKQGIYIDFIRYGIFKAGMNFKEFVKEVCKIPDEISDEHFRSQYTFITDENETLIVDFIGKFENLQEDFNKISGKIGLKNIELPKLMSTKHKHYTEYYDEETKKLVAERYKKDIEMFGYEFGK